MPRVLIVESSATLRHSLMRRFQASVFETVALGDFEEAVHLLQSGEQQFDAVVIGWPMRTVAEVDELLVMLSQPEFGRMAAVVMSEKSDPARMNWITQRPGTALLLWEEHRELIECLNALLDRIDKPVAALRPVRNDNASSKIAVLLVDDSPTIRHSYSKLLKANGYLVETASCVAEGFDKALEQRFDLAIIDYFMPDDTGDVLCKRLHEDQRTASITTSILTGTYLDKVIQDSLEAGAVECMFKNEAKELFLARVAAMSRSVRDRRSIERERRHLEGILDSVGDGVYGVDNNGQITFVNPAARTALGFTEDETLSGRDPHKLFHYATEDGRQTTHGTCFLTQAYATGEEISGWQTVFWTKDGRCFPVEGTIYPLHVDNHRTGSVVAFRDVSERKLMEEELRWQANHDALTKLLNRHYFEQELHREVQRIQRTGECSALVYIDLDQFKYINDTAGHAAGDQLLIEVSQRLSTRLRGSDTLARLGGDEFAIILRNVGRDKIFEVADTFRFILAENNFVYRNKQYSVNCSVGAAPIDKDTESPGEAMAHADLAAHIAKEKGRNQTHVYEASDEQRSAMDRDLGWSTRLNEALKNDAFELAFQPIISSHTQLGEIGELERHERWPQLYPQLIEDGLHYEVLLRLLGDHGHLIRPGAFLPAAERFSLMPAIDRWVIENTIKTLASLRSDVKHVLAVNLSAQTMCDRSLGKDIADLVEHYQVDPSCLSFEITETTAVTNLDAAQKLITELRALGCSFALDDFGSGFCSFGQLKHLDVDYIKIDGLFIQGLVSDPLDREVVLAINQIAHALGKRTVAEFVETREIMRCVTECGVDFVQGHCIAKALPELPSAHVVAQPTSRSASGK